MMESLFQDLRYAARSLRRNLGITSIALVSLALGIGVNTLVFTFINALFLRPLPYPDRDRVVLIESVKRGGDLQQRSSLNRNNCAELRNAAELFEAFGCYSGDVSSSIADGVGLMPPERLSGQRFTAGMLPTLGIQPLLGRWFTESDEQEGVEPVVLISYGLWQRRFGGVPDVLGKTLRVDGERATIIGVMPEEFELTESAAAFWIPFRSPGAGFQSPARILGGIARLKSGLNADVAQSMLDAWSLRLEEQAPEVNKGWRVVMRPLTSRYTEQGLPSALAALEGAVVFVLLIACANVTGLLLAQAVTQQKELAVRAALGSGRWRIVRQALMHSMMLSLLGGILGFAVGSAGAGLLRNVLPSGRLPSAVFAQNLDLTVLLFTFGASLLCGLIAGFVPALQISRTQPLDVLKEAASTATAGASRQRLRSIFVVAQIAMAFVLLAGAGLMFNSLIHVADFALGFNPSNLLTLEVQLPETKFRKPTNRIMNSGSLEMRIDPAVQLTSEQIRQNLATAPGVTSATAIAIHPPLGGALNMPIRIEGRQFQEPQRAQFIPVMPDYFSTLQVPVVRGREFRLQDTAASAPVAIINEAMARRYWPNANPLEQRIQIDTLLLPNEEPRQIIGVVTEVMQYSGQQDRPQIYLPYSQLPAIHDERLSNDFRNLTFIVRTPQPAAELTRSLLSAVANADSSQSVSRIRTMHDTAYGKEVQRVYVGLLGAFAAIAVILAVVGVYGVMAQIVSQRTNEIGIRMALGADRPKVRLLVLRQGSVLVAAGLFLGALGAIAVSRVLRGLLSNLALPRGSSTDPLIFAFGVILLGAIALLACYLPARRASRIDPVSALRHE